MWNRRAGLVFTVSLLISISATLVAFSSKKPAGEPARLAPNADSVWVQKPDGGTQCGRDQGLSLEKGAAELAAAKIKILSSSKVSDGKMHIQVCGAPTGSMNRYEIDRSDLAGAQKLGFEPAPVSQDMK